MIEKDKTKQGCWSVSTLIKETKEHNQKQNSFPIADKEPTAREVLEYLLGDTDGWCNGNFVIYKYDKQTKRTFLQRLNLLWVLPLFVLSAPLQLLIRGEVGINRNSWLGKIVDKMVKFK